MDTDTGMRTSHRPPAPLRLHGTYVRPVATDPNPRVASKINSSPLDYSAPLQGLGRGIPLILEEKGNYQRGTMVLQGSQIPGYLETQNESTQSYMCGIKATSG